MSGTSLDGLDICLSEFRFEKSQWNFNIKKAAIVPYNAQFKKKLSDAMFVSGKELVKLDADFGKWMGERVNEFLVDLPFVVDIIGSHGHTVFHEPQSGYTTQIGSGAHIAAVTGIPCVCNFRLGDVARGGQGAPLVPVGDDLLFPEYNYCLNLGGVSNISYNDSNNRVAFDICPCNMALNHLSSIMGSEFDNSGSFGRMGSVDSDLLVALNSLSYYSKTGSKSLGREWFLSELLPLINHNSNSTENKLRTVYEHIAHQISSVLSNVPVEKVLVTGGGAKNGFLIELLESKCRNQIVIPSLELVDFKEALIFGLLAVLYRSKVPSCLATVTGAKADSIGGSMFY